MLKKLFKALTTLTLLVGCYFAYVHAFAVVVEQLKAIKRTDNFVFAIHDSKSRQESIRYAIEACGADHWAADKELAYRYYNAERRYWIYAKDCERIVEENGVRYDGKRLRLTPFLLISKSSDGKNTKTITSDVAVFDLNEPLSFNVTSSAQPLKIKHARLEPNVWIRDDKGTPRDASDDMKIGPLTTVDYEESTQQITTQLDTYVVIQDPELSATAYGMVMQLRKTDAVTPEGSSGFEGVERLDLLKNVHVVMRDVGKSGMMSGTVQSKKPATAKAQPKSGVAPGSEQKPTQGPEPVEPTPLDLRCDAKMQVYLPKPRLPVAVGPPAPPAPTLVQFDRNVVVLRGRPDERPDQLTCDTLKLSLVPREQSTPTETPAPASGPKLGLAPSAESQPGADAQADPHTTPNGDTVVKTGNDENSGPLGSLSLQRVHATGHAVWLYLPAQGVKLVCNELIHVRQLPYKPDQTYFRGDRTRRLQLEKIDVVEEEGPDHGKITSVTNIWTVDATLFDRGVGMDATNIVAHGPGRLETRPDRDKAVERIAIWQDRLIVQNRLGPENEVVQKIIDLVGNRPCFIDNLQKTSLDSGSWIQVWMKPKPASPPATSASLAHAALAGTSGTGNKDAAPLAAASAEQTNLSLSDGDQNQSATSQGGSNAGMGSSSLQIEKLHARVDVHLLAPAKTMNARERLDAEFVQAKPVQVATNAAANNNDSHVNASDNSTSPPAPADTAAEAEQPKPEGQERLAAADQTEKSPEEPPMVGSCDRLWARIALKPKAKSAKASSEEASKTRSTSTGPGTIETEPEIRLVWMWGNVALHQDPKKDKQAGEDASGDQKGQDASGEALYLDNRGTNKAIVDVYQRDPTEMTYLPGPLPPAHIENDDIKIAAAGKIQMNQGTDQAWVHGPGILTQMAARGFMSAKSSREPSDDEPADVSEHSDAVARAVAADSKVKTRTTSLVTRNDVQDASAPAHDKTVEPKRVTRAGRPTSKKVPMTIGFSNNMEFAGRSVDPEGRPAAQAEFYGEVTAQMEDALLYCTRKMIAYTDREVPLAQLGKMSRGQSQAKADDDAANADGDAKTQAELTLIFCYRNAVAISRKVDPDAPILIQQQRIEATDFLAYDRRTGDFFVPRKGKVYLYDQNTEKSETPESGADSAGDEVGAGNAHLTTTQRTVSTTSGRMPQRHGPDTGAQPTGKKTASKRQGPQARQEPKANENFPLTLIQVHFNKGMRGQFGTSGDNDNTERRWSEFYGDVETARAKVPNAQTKFDFDRLPSDALFLTGQTLLVTQEPPPVGSPKSAASQYHMKAWERVYTSSNDKVLQSDVMTYDSHKDLIYAYGKDGHSVNFAEQHAAGQPISPGSAKAVQLNPKTGGLNVIDSNTIQLIDKNTGVRPLAAAPIDPFDKKKKPTKKPFKLPTMNIERRGFTGQ